MLANRCQMLELTEAGPPEEAGVSDAVITTDSDESEGATMPEAAKGLGASGSLESEVNIYSSSIDGPIGAPVYR